MVYRYRAYSEELDSEVPELREHPGAARVVKVMLFPVYVICRWFGWFLGMVQFWRWKRQLTDDEVADWCCQNGHFDVAAYYRKKARRSD